MIGVKIFYYRKAEALSCKAIKEPELVRELCDQRAVRRPCWQDSGRLFPNANTLFRLEISKFEQLSLLEGPSKAE